MNKYIFILFLLSSFALSPAFAKTSRIELNDGSIVSGQIVSYTNGVYAVNSQDMGTLLINESKIKNIGFEGYGENPSASADSSNPLPGQAENLKSQIMSNPKAMNSIAALKDDPRIQAIMNDPQIINAIKSGDFKALSKNEKFMSLTKDPKIQQIKDEVSSPSLSSN